MGEGRWGGEGCLRGPGLGVVAIDLLEPLVYLHREMWARCGGDLEERERGEEVQEGGGVGCGRDQTSLRVIPSLASVSSSPSHKTCSTCAERGDRGEMPARCRRDGGEMEAR